MLRITTIELPSGGIRLRLEGRLVGPWNGELRRVAEAATGPLQIDLAEVHYVDADGISLLRQLLASGAIADNASTFVQALLGVDLPGTSTGSGLVSVTPKAAPIRGK
jgi:hypothetical protein